MTEHETLPGLIKGAGLNFQPDQVDPAHLVSVANERTRRRRVAVVVAIGIAGAGVTAGVLSVMQEGPRPVVTTRPACVPPSVTLSGRGPDSILANVKGGAPLVISGTLVTPPGTNVADVALILAKPGAQAEVGIDSTGLPSTSAARAENQIAAQTAARPAAGAALTLHTAAPAGSGSYPVFALIHYSSTPDCSGSGALAGSSEVMAPLGSVQVG